VGETQLRKGERETRPISSSEEKSKTGYRAFYKKGREWRASQLEKQVKKTLHSDGDE